MNEFLPKKKDNETFGDVMDSLDGYLDNIMGKLKLAMDNNLPINLAAHEASILYLSVHGLLSISRKVIPADYTINDPNRGESQ